jgi:MOSC domain-containing protein YiiM
VERVKGKIIAVCISKKKGEKKKNVREGILRKNYGIIGDAHSGNWNRQVSLLSCESIDKIRKMGLKVKPGDFAENITVENLDFKNLKLGTKLIINDKVLLEVTQIGKKCENPCSIYYKVGMCIMPKEGIFAKVIKGGKVKVGDRIEILENV